MAYLFVFFTEEKIKDGEQVYFAVSKDGLNWTDLKEEGPILKSDVGDKGVRDPFILYNPLDTNYYIIATDLRIAAGKGWKHANTCGSKDIIVWKSTDLLQWQKGVGVRLHAMEALHAGCVWAPEAYYDQRRKVFVMYWASLVGCWQKMYAADTVDFQHFTNYRLFMESEEHIIDTTIVEDKGHFYRFSVNYGGIGMDRVDSIAEVSPNCEGKIIPIEGMKGMEGGIVLYLDSLQKWCLYADDSSHAAGYIPFLCNDLESGEFKRLSPGKYDMGKRLKRHGSIIKIADDVYERLIMFYGRAMNR